VKAAAANGIRLAGVHDALIIGAGHAGLAASRLLSDQRIDHVVLERGEVANSWRKERWDSLRLLTPNWQTRLPGQPYDGDDPDGFMTVSELVDVLETYARSSRVPLLTHTMVHSLRREGAWYVADTNRGQWRARSVILATGACNTASVPALADDLPNSIRQFTALDYRSPLHLRRGGVLVVGGSSTGLQLAEELLDAGHDVTLSVGEHVRVPRRYRGKDIFYWLDRSGIHRERYDEVEDLTRGRRLPSPQLVGRRDLPMLDLNYLQDRGVRLVGRFMAVRDGRALFSGSLRNACALADLKLGRLLDRIDETADREGAVGGWRFAPTRIPETPSLGFDFEREGITNVLWATGFRPDYRWLQVPVLDRKGRLMHDGGVVASPGLYTLGLPLMRRRKSSFIFGIEDDARDITDHLVDFLHSIQGRIPHGVHHNPACHDVVRQRA
jgi:putative flavoprotein involved in K+ transport